MCRSLDRLMKERTTFVIAQGLARFKKRIGFWCSIKPASLKKDPCTMLERQGLYYHCTRAMVEKPLSP